MSELHATKVVRLYADDFGESLFESLTIPMSHKEFAPPAAPVHVTEPRPVQHFVIIELPVGWGGNKVGVKPARFNQYPSVGPAIPAPEINTFRLLMIKRWERTRPGATENRSFQSRIGDPRPFQQSICAPARSGA